MGLNNDTSTRWSNELATTGRVELGESGDKMWSEVLQQIAVTLIVLAGLFFFMDVDRTVLILTIVIVAGALLIAVVLNRRMAGTRKIVVDTLGITLSSDNFVPWDQIRGVDVYRQRIKGSDIHIPRLTVTPEYMQQYLEIQGKASRRLTKANALMMGTTSIPLPTFLPGGVDELAAWLDALVAEKTGRAG